MNKPMYDKPMKLYSLMITKEQHAWLKKQHPNASKIIRKQIDLAIAEEPDDTNTSA